MQQSRRKIFSPPLRGKSAAKRGPGGVEKNSKRISDLDAFTLPPGSDRPVLQKG